MKTAEELERRRDDIAEWLAENAPYIVADQKHLDEHSIERAYWHYGYLVALRDVLGDVGGPGMQK
jgi:hypothetical protein